MSFDQQANDILVTLDVDSLRLSPGLMGGIVTAYGLLHQVYVDQKPVVGCECNKPNVLVAARLPGHIY